MARGRTFHGIPEPPTNPGRFSTAQYDQLVNHLDQALALLSSPQVAYSKSSRSGRRDLLASVFTKLYVTLDGVTGTELAELYEVLLVL